MFRVSTPIGRPVEEVWSRLTDWANAPQWMAGVESMRADGTTITFRAHGRERTSEITAIEPGRCVTLTSVQGGVHATYTYTCEPLGAGARVTLVAECRISGPLRLAGGLVRAAIRRADSGQLEALKRVVESDIS